MTKAIIPITMLRHNGGFPLDAVEVFSDHDAQGDDDLTYTMRVTVEEEDRRLVIAAALRERLPEDEAQALIKLLDEHDWDVSFLVDTF
jgi:hypothetical protein